VAIGGFTDQLLNPQTDEQKRKRNLEIIRNEVRRLEEVLLKLPRYLKLEIKEPKPFLLPIIFRHLLASFETRVKVKNIRLQVDIPEGLPLVKCDAMYAEEAIRNLLDNALDATPPGGEITIRSFTENKEWLVVTIQDTGKGMSEDIKAKIFVPFFSTKDKGFGLGLFYVKRVMDACGGMIQVESEEGKGTFFKLYFRYQERGVGQ
jgi:signal transduction histidine kinase